MSTLIQLSVEYFPEPDAGRPVSSGSIYVGSVDLDPEVVANQKQVSALQENGTTVNISQPISTGSGGVPLYNGSPVTLFVDGSYSLKVLDSAGSQVYYVPQNSTIQSVESVDTIAALRAMAETPESGGVIPVLGYYSAGDGGGGDFYWDATSTDADNNGTIIKVTSITTGRWIRLYSGDLKASYFGAIGDGTNRDSEIQDALSLGDNLNIPAGTYIYTTTIVPLFGQMIYGDGYQATTLEFQGTGRGFEATVQGLNRWEFSNLTLNGGDSTLPTQMIYINGPDDFLVDNIWGHDWYPGDGLSIKGDTSLGVYYGIVSRLKMNRINDTYSCNRGIVVDGTINLANSIIFNNPKIYRAASDAAYLHACRAVSFYHPNFELNDGYGFNFDSNKSGDSTFIYGVGIFGGYFEHNNQSGTETLFHSNSANTIGVFASGFRNIDALKDGTWTGRGNTIYSDGLEGQQISTLDSITDDDLGLSYQTAGKMSLKDVSQSFTSFVDYTKATGLLTLGNGNEVNIRGSETYGTYTTLSDDATPSVLGGKWFRLAHSGATTVTDFDDPLPGQVIILYASNTNTTIEHGTNIFLKGDANVAMATRDTMTLIYNGSSGEWNEI